MGESADEPRHVSSPELFTENFRAGVDFLGLEPFVDREKIAVLGICGSGGFVLAAAQVDTRIRAVVITSMYDMSAAARLGQTPEQIPAAKQALAHSVCGGRSGPLPILQPGGIRQGPGAQRTVCGGKCGAYLPVQSYRPHSLRQDRGVS